MDFDIDELLSCRKVPSQEELLPAAFRSRFNLGRIHQLGLAVPSVVEAAQRLEEVGIWPFLIAEDDLAAWVERGEPKSFHGKIGIAHLGGYELELLEAGRGSEIYSEAFRPDGRIALHHVGFLDHRVDERVRQMNEAGIETAVRGRIKLWLLDADVAYMDAREETGVYVEFIDYRLFGIPIRPSASAMKAGARILRLLGIKQLRMGQCD